MPCTEIATIKPAFRTFICLEMATFFIISYFLLMEFFKISTRISTVPFIGHPISFLFLNGVTYACLVYFLCTCVLYGTCVKSKVAMKSARYGAVLLLVLAVMSGSTYSDIQAVGGQNIKNLNDSWNQYGINEQIKQKIDDFQQNYKCCGVESYLDWSSRNSSCVNDTSSCGLPPSCFKNKATEETEHFKESCYKRAEEIYRTAEMQFLIACGVLIVLLMITLFTLEVRACLMPAVQDVLSPINVADHVDPPPPYNEINDDPPPRYDELELDVFEIPPPSYEDAVGIQESIV